MDNPKLDPMWERLGQLKMPISIHVADPKAFFEPTHPANERWAELKDHKSWWFGDTNKFPPWKNLLECTEPRHRSSSGHDLCLRAFWQ